MHPARVYVRRGDAVWYEGGGFEASGLVDLQAGYEALALLYTDRVVLDGRFGHDGGPQPDRTLALGRTGARAIALGPSGYLVVTETALIEIDRADAVRVRGEDLVDARAVAAGSDGRIYVAQGSPTALYRLDAGGWVSVARWLGDTRDLHFGLGRLLPSENLYIERRRPPG